MMKTKFMRAVAHLPARPVDESIVTETELLQLPEVVRRYFRFMGGVGRPRVWSLRCELAGRFRPDFDKPWYPCHALQYDTRLGPARLFYLSLRFGHVLPVLGRDTFVGGHGRMLVRALDAVTLADERGPELDAAELVTYLNDAILMAPSMLLGADVTWTGVDEATFDVTLSDANTTVTARVFLDERGAPINFSTRDRFYREGKSGWMRAEWTTPVLGFTQVDGRHVWSSAKAVWVLPDRRVEYADFHLVPGTLAYNLKARIDFRADEMTLASAY